MPALPEIPGFIKDRVLYLADNLNSKDYHVTDRKAVSGYDEANLVSSALPQREAVPRNDQRHMPVIDLDFECHLEPSTTPGHSHLYVNREISWRQYKRLLRALHEAGMIEAGFLRLSIHRGATFVRRPGVRKGTGGEKPLFDHRVSGQGSRAWAKPAERRPLQKAHS